jgi:hypothetical protein
VLSATTQPKGGPFGYGFYRVPSLTPSGQSPVPSSFYFPGVTGWTSQEFMLFQVSGCAYAVAVAVCCVLCCGCGCASSLRLPCAVWQAVKPSPDVFAVPSYCTGAPNCGVGP